MAENLQNLVGARVSDLRVAAGLSQDDLVARCQAAGWDVSRGTFAKIEAGLRRVNDGEVAMLAKVLRCSLEELLGGFSKETISGCVRNGHTD